MPGNHYTDHPGLKIISFLALPAEFWDEKCARLCSELPCQ